MHKRIVNRATGSRGFTLMEVLLAASIFTTVILIGVSTFTKMNQLNDRAKEQRSVAENGRFAMENITRSISSATGFDDATNNIHLQSVQICSSSGAVNPTEKTAGLTLVTVQTDNSVSPSVKLVSRFWLNDQKQLMVQKSDNPAAINPITSGDVTVEDFGLSGMSAMNTSLIRESNLRNHPIQPYVSISLTLKAVPLRSTSTGALQEFKTSTVVRDYLFPSRQATAECALATS